MKWFEFVLGLLPGLFKAIKEAVEDSGKDVEQLRKADLTVSLSFGGEEGEAVIVQRSIEELLSG